MMCAFVTALLITSAVAGGRYHTVLTAVCLSVYKQDPDW